MAHSPSPGSSALPNPLHGPRRLSPSPPPTHQPLSKRDKRRNMIDQRLKDLAVNFASNRDTHLRNQLNALSRDMQFISRAELYTNSPLDENFDDGSTDGSSVNTFGAADGDNRTGTGRFAAKFVEDVNNELEKRDAGLTDIDVSFKKHLESLKLDFKFAAEVAEAECLALKDSARNRVTTSIQNKRKQIQKEKDQLDSADSSILMNSHALTAITAPGSPGGLHGNRKTRHTRHRQEPDHLEAGDPQRRKRKAPVDFENESPAPARNASIDTFGTLLWDKSRSVADSDSNGTVVSVDKFFNSKELASYNRAAMHTVAQTWSDRRFRRHNQIRPHLADGGNGDILDPERGTNIVSDDDGDQEDPGALVAPLMDRTGSHATRSTRVHYVENFLHRESLDDEDPERSYGTAVLDASSARSKVAQSKDMEAPMTSGMNPQDVSDDLSIMQSLMDDD